MAIFGQLNHFNGDPLLSSILWERGKLGDKRTVIRTSLMVQWLGICQAIQGSRIWSLVWKITHIAEQPSLCFRSRQSSIREVTAVRSRSTAVRRSFCSSQVEKVQVHPWWPSTAKNKINFKKLKKRTPIKLSWFAEHGNTNPFSPGHPPPHPALFVCKNNE